MTYTQITAQTLVSDLADALNGVTTRSPLAQLLAVGANAATLAKTAGLPGYDFGLGDLLGLTVPIPARVDKALGATLVLVCAPTLSEATREVAFQVDVDTVHASSTVTLGTGTVSAASGDVSVPGTAGQAFFVSIALTASVWDSVTAGALAGEVSRIAIADGTEASDVAVVAAYIEHTIER